MYNEESEKHYEILTNFALYEWRKSTACPDWYDGDTRGCSHPDGVIIAGSSKDGSSKKVALFNLGNNTTVDLPEQEYPIRNIGMVYDDDSKMLTIAGGESYGANNQLTKRVFQLPMLTKDGWKELPPLQDGVANPMLVNDKEYLYVLGGKNSAKCVRMSKKEREETPREWEDLPPLPSGNNLPIGASLDEEYSGDLYCGAVWYQGKVRVLTRTQFLTLDVNPNDNTEKIWLPQSYVPKANEIIHLTPIIHDDMIVAVIERKQVLKAEQNLKITVEDFIIDENNGKIIWEKIFKSLKHSRIGAGRFVSFKAEE